MKIENHSEFTCEFCKATFNLKYNYERHIKTNKKCLEKRPKIEIKCIWCNECFMSNLYLENHYNCCSINKVNAYNSLLSKYNLLKEQLDEKDKVHNKKIEEKELFYIKQIEERDNQIKDLQDKLFTVANKSTTTNNYFTLNCDKPLLLNKERVIDLMIKYCNVEYLEQGGFGIAKWFLKYVCTNEDGKVCIECTDKKRKVFKYIDENDILLTKTKEDLISLMNSCKPEIVDKSDHYKEFIIKGEQPGNGLSYINRFLSINYSKPFINTLARLTHKDSLLSNLPKKKRSKKEKNEQIAS